MLDIMTNPILGGLVTTFAISFGFTRRDGKPPPSPELGNEPGQVFAAWQASAGV